MDFTIDEISAQAAQTARDFANRYIRPNVMIWDEAQEFPLHVFKEMGSFTHGCTGAGKLWRNRFGIF